MKGRNIDSRSTLWVAGSKKDRNRDVEPDNARFLTQEVKQSSNTFNLSRIASVIIEDAAENHRLARVERRIDNDLERMGVDPSALEPQRESRLKGSHTHADDDSAVDMLNSWIHSELADDGRLWEVNLSLPDTLCSLMREAPPSPRRQSEWFNHAIQLYRATPYQSRMERLDTKRQVLDYIELGSVVGETTDIYDAISDPDPAEAEQWEVAAYNTIFDGSAGGISEAERLEEMAEGGEYIDPEDLPAIRDSKVDKPLVIFAALPDGVDTKEGVREFIEMHVGYGYNNSNQMANTILNRFEVVDETVERERLVESIYEFDSMVIKKAIKTTDVEPVESSANRIIVSDTIEGAKVEELEDIAEVLESKAGPKGRKKNDAWLNR